jgi:hypothetical protein
VEKLFSYNARHRFFSRYSSFLTVHLDEQNFEPSFMSAEDLRSSIVEDEHSLLHAEINVKRAISFSKAGLDMIEAQQRNLQADDLHSWDQLEDGQAWQGLNMKRKLLMRIDKNVDKYVQILSKLRSITAELGEFSW